MVKDQSLCLFTNITCHLIYTRVKSESRTFSFVKSDVLSVTSIIVLKILKLKFCQTGVAFRTSLGNLALPDHVLHFNGKLEY